MTSTIFYSNTLSRPIDIPNDKVCGYRIKNYNTRTGWQSGLRAGLDNGVAPQKFSRFAYDWETKPPLVEPCSGNTNWYNHKPGDDLRPISNPTGRPFELVRPAYKSGGIYTQTKEATVDIANDRAGVGNRSIIRPAFMEEAPMARSVFDFDRLQALDIEQAGTKVQLGESTLAKLFEVKVPDPRDTLWTEERDRLVRVLRASGLNDQQIEEELRINKPLGREQRTVSKMQNIGTSGLGVSDKLKEIREEIIAGKAQTRAGQVGLIAQIATILNNQARVERLTSRDLQDISDTLRQLKVPKNWKALGIDRVVDGDTFDANKGAILSFLMSNFPPGFDQDRPLVSWSNNTKSYDPKGVKIQILFKLNEKTRAPRFLDLETRQIDDAGSLALKGLPVPVASFVPATTTSTTTPATTSTSTTTPATKPTTATTVTTSTTKPTTATTSTSTSTTKPTPATTTTEPPLADLLKGNMGKLKPTTTRTTPRTKPKKLTKRERQQQESRKDQAEFSAAIKRKLEEFKQKPKETFSFARMMS